MYIHALLEFVRNVHKVLNLTCNIFRSLNFFIVCIELFEFTSFLVDIFVIYKI